MYDAILIAKHGGVLVDIEPNNATNSIHQLIEKLKKKEIDGFVLDRYLLLLFYQFFEHSESHSDDVQFLKTQTIRTEISYSEDQFSYGILVKESVDYEFLADFMMDNRDVINTCNGLLINNFSTAMKYDRLENPLFSTSGEVFWPSFLTGMIIIAMICLFGFLYEMFRRHERYRNKCVLV